LKLRAAVPDDAPRLAEITRAAEATYGDWTVRGWEHRRAGFDEMHWSDLLAQKHRWTWVAVDGESDRVVGLVSVRPGDERDAGHVGYLFNDPSDWGRGAGRALLEAAIDEIRSRGLARATLRVPVHNERARRLYERNGFADTGGRRINKWLGFEMAEYERRF
jgi:RimJ/RimL family protein N-acetyltransferase